MSNNLLYLVLAVWRAVSALHLLWIYTAFISAG
jgi:hypothetical protein